MIAVKWSIVVVCFVLYYVSDARTSISLPVGLFYAFCSRRYSTVIFLYFFCFKHVTSELVVDRFVLKKHVLRHAGKKYTVVHAYVSCTYNTVLPPFLDFERRCTTADC